jgi:hypothetical protein
LIGGMAERFKAPVLKTKILPRRNFISLEGQLPEPNKDERFRI